MMPLAQRNGMGIVPSWGETDTTLNLPPADALGYLSEVFEQRVALVDCVLNTRFAGARRIADTLAAIVASRNDG